MNLRRLLSSVFLLVIWTTDIISHTIPELCLTEDCIMASATILGSLDKSANPCQNFYQFACGGWMQKALRAPADRFEAIDKLNQNLILKILDESLSSSDSYIPPSSANGKARAFYQSCISNKDKYHGTIQDLATIIQFTGGWTVLDDAITFRNNLISFEKRMQILQNDLAVNVFFIRGLIRHDGRKRLAIVAGGWNKGLAEMTSKSLFEEPLDSGSSFRKQYLQMMIGIVMELWKVSYAQQYANDQLVEEPKSDFDNNLNATEVNDVEYNYDIEFIPEGLNYPDAMYNISGIEDYHLPGNSVNYSSESINDTSNSSLNYEFIKDQNINTLSEDLHQLYEWIKLPFQWISKLSGCPSGNTSSDDRYDIFSQASQTYEISVN